LLIIAAATLRHTLLPGRMDSSATKRYLVDVACR